MTETFVFRLFESEASRFLDASEGKPLGIAREVRAQPTDALFKRIEFIQRNLLSEGRALIASWWVTRSYTKKEVQDANWFYAEVQRAFEPEGELFGTKYDESESCSICGYGARQTSSLVLPRSRIPKGPDIARTIAGEIVVSRRLVLLAGAEGIEALRVMPILDTTKQEIESHLQLLREPATADMSEHTRFGESPFSFGPDEARCRLGHVLGLRRLSELAIRDDSLSPSELQFTKQATGVRRGALRPESLLLVSARFRSFFIRNRLKGLSFEVAHTVS